MTYSPIISAAGGVPDSTATDPAGTAVNPANAMPDPAVAPASSSGSGQSAQPAADAGYAGYSAGQAAAATGQADSSAGDAGHGGYSTDQGSAAAEQAAYAADQGAYATEQGAYATEQGPYAADSATGSAPQDETGAAWPHQTFLELGALATAAPCARLHTTLVLWEWGLGTLVSAAGLVVSELVSNAVAASASLTGSRFAGYWAPGIPPVRVWLSADDHRVVIQVWDGSDRPPVPQPVEPEADSGRGLLLVGALSEEWGCYTPEKSSGKVVWAVVTA